MKDAAEVENRLRDLAADPDFRRRENSLGLLADAISGPDGFLWAKVNLFDAFGEESLTLANEREKLARLSWLELVRNFAILLPLLWTWLAIALAISAFNRLLETTDAADAALVKAPFIEQWASGFGGRTWVNFSWVALIDAILIGFVVLLSFVVGYQRKRLDVDVENRRTEKWNQLREALTDASVVLAAKAYDTPARFNEELTKLWVQYQGVADQMRNASRDLQRAVENSGAFTAGVKDATDEIAAAGAELTQIAAGFQEHLSLLATEIKALNERGETLASSVNQLIGSHTKAGPLLDDALTRNVAAAESVEQSVRQMAQSVQQANSGMVQAVRDEVSARSAAAADVTRAAENAQTLSLRLEEAAARFHDAAETLQRAADGLPAGLHDATSELGRSVEIGNVWLTEVPERLAQGLEPLSGFSAELAEVTDQLSEVKSGLNTVATALDGASGNGSRGGQSRLRRVFRRTKK